MTEYNVTEEQLNDIRDIVKELGSYIDYDGIKTINTIIEMLNDIKAKEKVAKTITQDTVRDCAIEIVDDIIEEVLDRFDISLPCQSYEEDERKEIEEDNGHKNRVFGELYYEVEDRIIEKIRSKLTPCMEDDKYKCEVRKV